MTNELALVVLLLVVCSTPVLAHDAAHWIQEQGLQDPLSRALCCGERDCHRVDVEETAGGYLVVETKEVISHSRVIWKSRDGWWRCKYSGNETRCLIGVLPGS